jgi:predicted permease
MNMELFVREVRLAARSLARNPTFTLFAVLTLALCIGANTAIFSLIKGFFLKSLPVRDAQQLVAVYATDAANPGLLPVSYPNYLDYRGEEIFAGLAAYRPFGLNVGQGAGNPEPFPAEIVSGNYFDVLGVEPALGRAFLPEDDAVPGARPVVILSHGFWQEQLAGDPAWLGRTIRLNGQAFTVIGIAPEGFTGLNRLRTNHLWVPMMMHAQILPSALADRVSSRGALMFNVVGRLRPATTLETARSGLTVLAEQLEREHPQDNADVSVDLLPLSQATIRPEIRQKYVLGGALLLGVVSLLLLIGCASVANLLVARALARQREVAVRSSLGAPCSRLIGQWLTEAMLLTVCGAGLGVLVGAGLRNALWALRPPFLPASLDFSLDARVLAYTLLVSVVTGILFGLAPLPQLYRTDLSQALRQVDDPSRGLARGGLRRLIVVAQVAISLVALVGAGLFLKSLWKAQATDLGFDADRFLVLLFDTGMAGLDEARGRQLGDRLVEQVASLPDVRSASLGRGLMLSGSLRSKVSDEARGPASEGELTCLDTVGVSYFETVGIPLLRGRDFARAERQGSPPVAIVNEDLAKRLWPGGDAVGRRLRIEARDTPIEVVGVVQSARQSALAGPEPCAYLPFAQNYSSEMVLYVRTQGEPASLILPVRRELQSLDSDVPILEAEVMSNIVAQALWIPRLGAALLAVFGGVALLLSAIGLYGVMSFSARHRRREIGIRLALGARRSQVLRLVILKDMPLVGAGVALGLAAALGMAPRVAGLLFSVSATDVGVLKWAVLVLVAVALVASYLPARQAAAVDPILVIREP